MKRSLLLVFSVLLIMVLAACGGNEEEKPNKDNNQENEESSETMADQNKSDSTDKEDVLVSLKNKDGDVVATATLTEDEEGVHVALEGEKLPAGTHGFHIHEKGACEAPDFKSAGGHFNPTDAKHGFDVPEGPHAGDMKNIEVGEDGTVQTERMADMVTLKKGEANSLFKEGGTALVIHSGADDYKSQPSGDAGERIACGVIGE
ncbi:superoxide dismutase family protein [Virgibacillus halodenitrificans]|uniref:superoxide dismutase family protein n=1 Tax=Virgibacillus halodenitrificans TaxID=1482 RepID=UPI00045D3E5D|nr:superoxide dismutase family protein [Virgibacillus halodenitrificans]MCG1029149.1 superoxide dismutase family protein [Virgibacillus halodenitrificans]CDQ31665.1 Superoxide dismutase-like protein YojM precursor [Virgibacillus halodenitrificans]